MSSFSFKTGEIERITKNLVKKSGFIGDAIERKVRLATQIVYTTARARRPKMSVKDLKASKAPRYFRKVGGKMKEYRVSDPDATLGVPVDTGKLRNSITMSVSRNGEKTVGEISAGNGVIYAKMIEFGTSKMRARPFMRPAINENGEQIKKIFLKPIDKI